MREAQQRLEEAKREESLQAQEDAKEALLKAKAELEEILRQLREEEKGRRLALLEGRFRKMLEMQLHVYEETKLLDQIPDERRAREFDVQSGRLAFDERKIVLEANKALQLLREEGSSIAFPETVEMMRDDMEYVSNRLADSKVSFVTQGREEDVISALEELIEALQKAQQDMEEQQQQQSQQSQSQQQQVNALVDAIAEFKMVRALQMRVNKRTDRYSQMLTDPDDQIGQAEDAELRQALKDLSSRERRLTRIMRDILLQKNR